MTAPDTTKAPEALGLLPLPDRLRNYAAVYSDHPALVSLLNDARAALSPLPVLGEGHPAFLGHLVTSKGAVPRFIPAGAEISITESRASVSPVYDGPSDQQLARLAFLEAATRDDTQPGTEKPSGFGVKPDLEALCAALLDGAGCTPWASPTWDNDGTDGASREGVRASVRRILAVLQSKGGEP